jgi:hypothetical protein
MMSSLLDTKVKDKINQRIFTDSTTCNPERPFYHLFVLNPASRRASTSQYQL